MMRLIEYDNSLRRDEGYEAQVSKLLFVALAPVKRPSDRSFIASAGKDQRDYKGEDDG